MAFVLNSYHARIWKNLAVKRIVLGREVFIKQAAKMEQETAIEVELFIHGAMCMSYSGHCTISNNRTPKKRRLKPIRKLKTIA